MNIVNVGYRSTNYYVLANTSGVPLLLVDAGWPGTLPQFQYACTTKGIRLADISYQLVTHYHPDHAGLAQELKHLGVRLMVIDTQLAGIPLLSTYVKPQDNYTPIDLEGNTLLTTDESRGFLSRIGIQGEIISTPGHSDDSITLVLDEGIAFTGDLTSQLLLPDEPANLTYQSWEKLRSLGVKTIYPGHGPPGRI